MRPSRTADALLKTGLAYSVRLRSRRIGRYLGVLLVLPVAGCCGWTTVRVYELESAGAVRLDMPRSWYSASESAVLVTLAPGATLRVAGTVAGAGLQIAVNVRVSKEHRVRFDPPEVVLTSPELPQPVTRRLSEFSVYTLSGPGVVSGPVERLPASSEVIGPDRNVHFDAEIRTLGVQPEQFTLRFGGIYLDGVRIPDVVVTFTSHKETHASCFGGF